MSTNRSSINSYGCAFSHSVLQPTAHHFQPYGRINDLGAPTPTPAGTPRSATLTFVRPRSAAIARNVLHGLNVGETVIRLNYQKPIQAHAIRDWMGSHPKITLPLIVFLLGSLTYTVRRLSHPI